MLDKSELQDLTDALIFTKNLIYTLESLERNGKNEYDKDIKTLELLRSKLINKIKD